MTPHAPPVPYAATAVRPSWADLPGAVRAAIEARLGSPVVRASGAGGGFTGGFAAVLRCASGTSSFVKATPVGSPVHPSYAREALLNPLLPARVPAPRVRWAGEVEGWFVLAADAVPDGRVPGLPWTPADLDAVLAAVARTGRLLATLPAGLRATGPGFGQLAMGHAGPLPSGDLPVGDLVEGYAEDFSVWRRTADGVTVLDGLEAGVAARVDDLAAIEEGWVGAAGEGLVHADLRPDNTLVDAGGRAWVCDWNWAVRGAPWFDLVCLLPTVHAGGLDASAALSASPLGRGVPAAAVDGVLAGLCGFFAEASRREPFEGASPWLVAHRRWYGSVTYGWLAERRGWPSGRRGRSW